jgi:hypothetical protein
MLITLGVDSFLADIAIPFVWFIPGAIDPDAASVIEIIKAAQRGLRACGLDQVRVTGVLDSTTGAALDRVSPSWMEKSFVQILGDIIHCAKNPEEMKSPKEPGAGVLGSYFEYQGIAPGPLPGFMVGTPPGPLGDIWDIFDPVVSIFDGDPRPASSSSGAPAPAPTGANAGLTFGQGAQNKANIVPIPKSSGFTYNAFVNLQRQINRLLSKAGGRISEDGIIGPGTFSAFKKAQNVVGQSISGDSNSLQLAEHAISVGAKLKQVADSMGIGASVNKGGSSSAASVAEGTSGPMTQQQRASFGGGAMASLKKYAPFLVLAAGVAWFAKSQKGKR